MNAIFWSRLHGGATHFPIALIFAAALFDALGFFLRGSHRQHQFKVLGYWLAILGALSSFGAVFSGLALSKWMVGGSGLVFRHHLFVWPAFAIIVALGTWRGLVGPRTSRRAFALYLTSMVIGCALISVAGFFGGEMLLGR
ncbi:MAG: DUF2231 domain-containing protein [Chthoniobacterales bacterium]